ncbi:glycosyltransferase family 4 protein [Azospirillum isscasi]|uniref:Glycosyltransferase family 1 protein n=1 Tax=Azospirillum isscasi TaxID=3053926 RepID=A0ABU0WD10_9PROT|nr:glycosyltransferase family 1 protein [Azospirillum isscasi]MDQ2102075.1 glycosyltransferase family 1 protein [Azospirillum isscasi]
MSFPQSSSTTGFTDIVERLASTEPVARILAVGAGPGRDALLRGMARNPLRPTLASARAGNGETDDVAIPLPNAHEIGETWLRFRNDADLPPLADLLSELEQDMRGHSAAPAGAGAQRPRGGFGLLMIEEAGFAGLRALDRADDTATVVIRAGGGSGWVMRRRLRKESGWEMIAQGEDWAAFRRSPLESETGLPIHFFTIVLNGEPFIRYHEAVFASLPLRWHWHIVEGVASLSHDTGWSLASGGRVLDSVHDRGRSNDGTSGYLDELAARYPDRVTIHRKPLDSFWDGKREMVNAPLPHIREPGLLWQVDADELWTAEQIRTVHAMFEANPKRTAAFYWCDYFVGPERIISTRHNYAQNPRQEWLRTWRFEPGMAWAAHEPPTLVGADGKDLAQIDPFTQDEMEEAGVVFQHFAYATEAQAAFKESYYGYKDARAHWRRLQEEVTGSALLRDYLPWVSDETLADTAASRGVVPIAVPDDAAGNGAGNGAWRFLDPAEVAERRKALTAVHPKILVDGVFYQHLGSGIARVWTAVLHAWAASGFAEHVVLLDRAGTAPRIPGIHTRTIRAHDKASPGADSLHLERICREEGADLFVSTYYTAPTATPSVFMGYDMIPEALGFPLADETWREKHRAILHASAHIMISKNSARDLERLFPSVPAGSTAVAYCGAGDAFRPAEAAEVDAFRKAHGLTGPYVLMVGERSGYQGYKNGLLLFRALGLGDPATRGLTVLCVGGAKEVEPMFRALAPDTRTLRLSLSDEELRLAYAGAEALAYPSRYEGFGMPVVEAMACGCPVITCANSSLIEVAGDAALFVGEDDAAGVVAAIAAARDPERRAGLVARGLEQAVRFTFRDMAATMAAHLLDSAEKLKDGRLSPPPPVWQELRTAQAVGMASGAGDEDDESPWVLRRRLERSEQHLRTVQNELTSMQNSPFWRLRAVTLGVLVRLGVNWRR